MQRKLNLIDIIEETLKAPEAETLSDDFGRNLDTIEKARRWITNPKNWHRSDIQTIRWNGLLCTISDTHGRRLLREPWDNGYPWVIMIQQMRIKKGWKVQNEAFSDEEE